MKLLSVFPRQKVDSPVLDEALAELENNTETIDTLLEKIQNGHLKSQLETIQWLYRYRGALEPRPEFIEHSRARLVMKVKTERAYRKSRIDNLKEAFARVPFSKKFAYRIAVVLPVLLMFIMLMSRGIVAVEETAIPGDTLYPIKELMEITRLNLTFSQIGQTALHIQMAGERLSEIQMLMMDGREELIPATFDKLEREIDQALDGLTSLARTHPDNFKTLSELLDERVTRPLEATSLLLMEFRADYPVDLLNVLNGVLARLDELEAIENGISPDVTPAITPIGSSVWTRIPSATYTPYQPSATPTIRYTSMPSQTEITVSPQDDHQNDRATNTPRPKHTPKPTNTHRPEKVPPEKSKDMKNEDK